MGGGEKIEEKSSLFFSLSLGGTGTSVTHGWFRRRTTVISNAESAIYASGVRMGGVAPSSAVPLPSDTHRRGVCVP